MSDLPTDLDVVCLSSIDWDFLWQGHQQIMAVLARQGCRVLFVENSGVRAPRLRDAPRLLRRLRRWWQGDRARGFRDAEPGLTVLSPLLLPFPYSKGALGVNRRVLLSAIERWRSAARARPLLLWTFLPTRLALAMKAALGPRLSLYYCVDDLASSSPAARRIAESEEAMFRTVDLVFVTSRALRERASGFSDRVHIFPFGVDLDTFEQARTADTDLPPALRTLRAPLVGYVGGVHQWVDQDLLLAVARRLPHLTFVLVGPVQCDVSRLERCPNVKLIGRVPHGDLPSYLRGFAIGIVPYVLCRYTDHVYPTKLNEYLAMGLPVVATPIPELRALEEENPGLTTLAGAPADFATALESALSSDTPAARTRRMEAARSNGWSARIARMRDVIGEALAHGPEARP